MIKKDAVLSVLVKTLWRFAEDSAREWDQVYCRFYSANPGHRSIELLYRKHRSLNGFMGKEDDLALLQDLMLGLFEAVQQETSKRPLVAVATVDRQRSYNVRFDHDDAGAMEISLMNLGRPESYYAPGQIDIPDHVRRFQEDMLAAGNSESPAPFAPPPSRGRTDAGDPPEIPILQTMTALMQAHDAPMDRLYGRFQSEGPSHVTQQFVYRKDRCLYPLDAGKAQREVLDTLTSDFFDALQGRTGRRPLVAVIGLTPDCDYVLKLDHDEPGAYQIGSAHLGRPHSFFSSKEVDMP